jgi:hypothetical protein
MVSSFKVTLAHYNSTTIPTAHVALEQLSCYPEQPYRNCRYDFIVDLLHHIIIRLNSLSHFLVFLHGHVRISWLFDYDIIFSVLALTFCFFWSIHEYFSCFHLFPTSMTKGPTTYPSSCKRSCGSSRSAGCDRLGKGTQGTKSNGVLPRDHHAIAQVSAASIVRVLTLSVCLLAFSSVGRTVMCMQATLSICIYLPRSFVED